MPESIGPELDTPIRDRGGWRFTVFLAAAALLGLAAPAWWLRPGESLAAGPASARTVVVEAGPIEQVIRISGTTSSINFAAVSAPASRTQRGQVLLKLVESGRMVRKGDVVAVIDPRAVEDEWERQRSDLLVAQADVRKRRAEHMADRESLRHEITVAAATYAKWQAEAGAAEVRTIVDRELLDLGVEESASVLDQKREEMNIQTGGQVSEMRILELTSQRRQLEVERHEYDLARYTVTSPVDGMAVRQDIIRAGETVAVREGEGLRPGMVFLKVMDLDHMQVEGLVNQADSNMLRIGQPAVVGLDAFPDLRLTGRVRGVGALAQGSSSRGEYVRLLSVSIEINGQDRRLMPDLSAHADVTVARRALVTRVVRAAVFPEAGQDYVYVKAGATFEKRAVELGFRNHTHAEVVSGLEPGDEVALAPPPASR